MTAQADFAKFGLAIKVRNHYNSLRNGLTALPHDAALDQTRRWAHKAAAGIRWAPALIDEQLEHICYLEKARRRRAEATYDII